MSDIHGVEIFATGTHNGDTYTERDLDDMVSAFRELDYRPALKVGHTKNEPGAPAYGWVSNLRRVGSKLLADFVDMHDSVVDAIRKRSYDRVSAEVYFNLTRGAKFFRRALKGVALLGAEVPAVAGLKPLHAMEFRIAEFSLDYEAFAARVPRDAKETKMWKALTTREAEHANRIVHAYEQASDNRDLGRAAAGVKVNALAKEYQEAHTGIDYLSAVVHVLDHDAALARQYRDGTV